MHTVHKFINVNVCQCLSLLNIPSQYAILFLDNPKMFVCVQYKLPYANSVLSEKLSFINRTEYHIGICAPCFRQEYTGRNENFIF